MIADISQACLENTASMQTLCFNSAPGAVRMKTKAAKYATVHEPTDSCTADCALMRLVRFCAGSLRTESRTTQRLSQISSE